MLPLRWRGLETESRTPLDGHEGGNPGYSQGEGLRATAPVLDPTNSVAGLTKYAIREGLTSLDR